MIYTICVMLVGAGAFAFVIGNIATLIVNSNIHKAERRKKLKALSTFMNHYEISDELQHNLYNFYNHKLAHSLSDSDAEIIDKLPPKLQTTLRRHISCHTLSRVDLFSMASEDELATLGQRLQTVVFSPGDEIISIGTPGREMYFITHGVVGWPKCIPTTSLARLL